MAARVVVILTLLALGGIAGSAVEAPAAAPPALPGADALIAGSGWTVDQAYNPVQQKLAYRVWLLTNESGAQAQLFIGATAWPQAVVGWTGELGYLGEGYVMDGASVINSGAGRITMARIHRGADNKLVAYAAVRPDGVVASGTDSPFGLAWDAVAHRGEPYFVVRVTVSPALDGHADASVATGLLTTVVSSLVNARSGRG
jgi:hypothetical protein